MTNPWWYWAMFMFASTVWLVVLIVCVFLTWPRPKRTPGILEQLGHDLAADEWR